MSSPEPRGNVERTFLNTNGETVAVISWSRGNGPSSAKGDFTVGQMITVRGGKVVGG